MKETLIIDNREHDIIEIIKTENFKKQYSYANVNIETKSMTVGDFAYIHEIENEIETESKLLCNFDKSHDKCDSSCRADKVIFLIERKTWKDLANTITGDRYKNVEKMISVNCKHFYFIEGKFNPERTSHVGNGKSLTYGSMMAH